MIIRLLFVLLLTGCAISYGEQYLVGKGETIESIASSKGVSPAEVREMNYLLPGDRVFEGDIIFLPAATGGYAKPRVRGSNGSGPVVSTVKKTKPKAKKPVVDKRKAARPASSRKIAWPLGGKVMKKFDPKGGKGIEISARPGQLVASSASGKVSYAGIPARAYGSMVIIDHGKDFYTVYSNMTSLKVKSGQRVNKGDSVGVAGDYLHFEVRDGGRPRNPVFYLPKR